MATRKPGSASTSGNAGKKPAAKKPASSQKKPAPKAEPVVLDPPKRATPPKPKPADVIDAKAVEVKSESNPAEPKPKAAEAPKAEPEAKAAKPAPEKTEEPAKKPEAPQEAVAKPKSPVLGYIIGGVIAAGIGYGVSEYTRQPPPPIVASIDTAELDRQFAALSERIDVIESELAASSIMTLEQDILDLRQSLADSIASLDGRISASKSELSDLIADFEASTNAARTQVGDGLSNISENGAAALSAMQAELEALKDRIGKQEDLRAALETRLEEIGSVAREKLQAAQTEAADLAAKAAELGDSVARDVAMQKLRAALLTGASYAEDLANVVTGLGVEAPEALSKSAVTGIATITELETEFPTAAREGLRASIRATAGDSATDKLTAFVKSQLGARSLEPKEGDDPDAVLSRAEAALKTGDLAEAVALVEQLPPEGIAAMQDWVDRANQRLAAEAALDSLLPGAEQ